MDLNMFQSTPTLATPEEKAAADSLNERLLNNQDDIEEQVILDEALQTTNVIPGEKQPRRFRDAWAACLFLSHLVYITYLAIKYGTLKITVDTSAYDDPHPTIRFGGLLAVMILSAIACSLATAAAMTLVVHYATQLIQITVLLSVALDVLLLLFFLSGRYWYATGATLVFTIIAALYCRSVWYRIPFAAANLQTAITAVQSNGGIWVTAYAMNALLTAWTLVWIISIIGLYTRKAECHNGFCESHMNEWVIAGLLLSYYWTSQVIKNVLHATVAGIVGTFWFQPDEACTFWSPALADSTRRASTLSLGSIAFGSLLSASLQVMYQMIREIRTQYRGQALVVCVLEFLVGLLESIVTYFNKWAYVYVGLYGYDYLTAGKSVVSLFASRGWTTIINDDLTGRVLALFNIILGLLTGCFGLWLYSVVPSWLDEFGGAAIFVAFCLPFLVGWALSNIITSVVASAVDTVVVCFAESPLQFEQNHPGLNTAMISAYRQVYPQEFGL